MFKRTTETARQVAAWEQVKREWPDARADALYLAETCTADLGVTPEPLCAAVVERSWPGLAGVILRRIIITAGVATWALAVVILVSAR